jgi:sugar lactone lactonase YvrE
MSNGNVTYSQIQAFSARTLKLRGTLNGEGYGALVADRSGYLYGSNGVDILVYAPGCTDNFYIIHGCGCWPLAFDESGNLYAGAGSLVRVYSPTKKPGHMKLVRTIYDGIDGTAALAVGPSGELFVANSAYSSVAVFASGGSEPTRQITKGIGSPDALAVDSKGRLYVANQPESAAGWISVYAAGGTRPVRKIGGSKHFFPDSLAVDPSDNVYVGIRSSVNVYTPGAAKLLRRIANHAIEGTWALLIGSP